MINKLLEEGMAHHKAGRLQEAHRCYSQIINEDPAHADALNLLGAIAGEQQRFGKAVDFFERAISHKPKEPVYRNNLGNTLIKAKEYDLAVEQLEEAVRLRPNYSDALCNLAAAYMACGDLDDAREILQKVKASDPNNRRVPLLFAQVESSSGDTARAVNHYKMLFADRPSLSALQGILLSEKATPQSQEIAEAEEMLRRPDLTITQRSILMHALGKAYDDIGRYDEAFRIVERAKQMEAVTFDLKAQLRWVENTCSIFDAAYFRDRTDFGNDSEVPVFIVGMPRSGTTLVEQIVASHPRASGAGELPHLSRVARAIGARLPGPEIDEDAVRSITRARVEELANVYLLRLTKVSSNAEKICDKAPLNGSYVGVAKLLFPKIKIIHCRRNPIDNCISIFMQKFAGQHNYSYDLRTLGRYYGAFAELMEHWQRLFPDSIREIKYEDTVADLEKQARGIIDFLGLDWSDACLEFQKTERAVMTASKWQVRRPVYTSSVQRWRRYEKHLEPLIQGLGKHAAEAVCEQP